MTFYDPASIESDCDTRGRDNQKYQIAAMLLKILFWITIIQVQNVFGIPTTEGSVDISTNSYPTIVDINNSTISPISSTISEIEDLHGIKANSSDSVIFVDIPRDTETTLGTSVLLECRTAYPVADCQWSWQPLPPVNLPLPDINPQLNSNETTPEIATVSPTTMTQSLPLRRFPAFGNNSNDCSVRFTETNYKQIGYWTCAARSTVNDSFISTSPAMLSITNDESRQAQITILKTEETQEAEVDSTTELICRTDSPVKECQWSWRLFNQTEVWNIEIRRFPAFGDNSTDCSIKLRNILRQQEGLWTCGVRADLNSSFIQAKPVWFFVSEVEFIQLSRGIQTAAGESALLRCLVNKPVVQCEWSWKPLNSSKEPMVMKDFVPNDDNKHDCSVRFKNVLYVEEGLWTCRVRLTHSGKVHEAAPTTLTLLPSAKISFFEVPENKSVVVASSELLTCTASSKVEKCTWLWQSLDDAKVIAKYEYPSTGNLGKNCSLYFPQIRIEDQGYWACQVSVPSTNAILTSRFAKIIVYNQEKVEFSELSQDIQISSGGSVFLRCVTSSVVEQCRWSLTPVNSNTTVVIRQFSPVGSAGRDCSVRLSHALAEQEGLWTCGVKAHGTETYINAPPAKLSLLEPVHKNCCSRLILLIQSTCTHHKVLKAISIICQNIEPIIVTILGELHEKIIMACKFNNLSPDSKCRWIHKSNETRRSNDAIVRLRQSTQLNHTSGICTLQFKPDIIDLGMWMCQFFIEANNSYYELGNTTLNLLMYHKEDTKLGWIVGSVTTLILFFMILVVVIVVCKTKLFTNKSSRIFETAPLKPTTSPQNHNHNHNQNLNDSTDSRLSDRPSSINSLSNFSSNEMIYRNGDPYGHINRGHYQPTVYERFNTS